MAFINFILVNAFGIGLFAILGFVGWAIVGDNAQSNLLMDIIFWIVGLLLFAFVISLNKKYVFDLVPPSSKTGKQSIFNRSLNLKEILLVLLISVVVVFCLIIFQIDVFNIISYIWNSALSLLFMLFSVEGVIFMLIVIVALILFDKYR